MECGNVENVCTAVQVLQVQVKTKHLLFMFISALRHWQDC